MTENKLLRLTILSLSHTNNHFTFVTDKIVGILNEATLLRLKTLPHPDPMVIFKAHCPSECKRLKLPLEHNHLVEQLILLLQSFYLLILAF